MSAGTSRRRPGSVPRALVALLAIALVAALLAGCTMGPTDDAGDATSPVENESDGSVPEASEPPTLPVLGVDANATWNRTLELLDVEARRPSVDVRATDASPAGPVRAPDYVTAFTGAEWENVAGAWYDPASQSVTVRASWAENHSAAFVESVLAHEFTHAVQYQRGWDSPNRSAAVDTDRTVSGLYGEGMATYVQNEYARAVLGNESAAVENGSVGDAIDEPFVRALYVEGARYYDERLDSPRNLSVVVDDPPSTAEQVLHGTDEPARPLSVDPEYEVQTWSVTHGRSEGELRTREVLRIGLDRERAARAAAGWGNDDLLTFDSPARDQSGYVWVHRWDDADEADEFEAAAGDLLSWRRDRTDEYAFDRRRPAPEVTALVAGQGGFAEDASVNAAGNATVTVSVPS